MGIGLLPDAQVWASQSAAERIRSGEARASVETETRPFGVVLEGLDGMRVDELVPADDGPYQSAHGGPRATPPPGTRRTGSPPGSRGRGC